MFAAERTGFAAQRTMFAAERTGFAAQRTMFPAEQTGVAADKTAPRRQEPVPPLERTGSCAEGAAFLGA